MRNGRITVCTTLMVIIASLLARPAQGQERWRQAGPYGGKVAGMAAIGSTIFLSTPDDNGWVDAPGNGLYRSLDGGDHWMRIPYNFDQNAWNSFLVHDSTVYFNGRLLYRSTDLGATWTNLDLRPNAIFVGDTLFYAWYAGDLHASTDLGDHWFNVGNIPGGTVNALSSLGSTLLAGTDHGLYRSTDGGHTWTLGRIAPSDTCVMTLGAYNGVILVASGPQPSVISNKIYRSTDGGATWKYANNGNSSDRINQFLPYSGTTIFAAGGYHGGLFRSDNNGASWAPVDGGFTDEIETIAKSGSSIFCGSGYGKGGGVYRSTDGGAHWSLANTGFSSLHALNAAGTGADLYLTTNSNGVFHSSDHGATWEDAGSIDPINSQPAITISGDAVFIGQSYFGANVGGGVRRSLDKGRSWQRVGSEIQRSVTNLTSHDGNIVAAEDYNGGSILFRSTDQGTSWNLVSTALGDKRVNDFRYVGSNLYAATDSGLYRSTDNGEHWSPFNDGIVAYRVLAVGGYGDILVVGTSDDNGSTSIYRWNAAAQAFVDAFDNSDQYDVKSIIEYNHILYAGYYGAGVYRSLDDGKTWEPFNDGLDHLTVSSLAVDGTELVAATDGGGAFTVSLGPLGVERIAGGGSDVESSLYPSPARAEATIRFVVPEMGTGRVPVELRVVDVIGNTVATLVDETREPGAYGAAFNTGGLAAGTYFYRLRIGTRSVVKSFVVM